MSYTCTDKWRLLDFFAGSGLVTYGLQNLFYTAWANDISASKAAVYTANFPNHNFMLGDIAQVNGAELPQAHVAWASFPCQDLSLAGNTKGIHASRSGLVWQFLRVLDEMPVQPSVLALENVLGLVSTHNGRNYAALHEALEARGYTAGAVVVDASRFVPQSRVRVFVFAVRGLPPGKLTSSGPCWLHNKAITTLGNKLENWVWWAAEEPPPCNTTIADILDDAHFDRQDVLPLIPTEHMTRLMSYKIKYATGYRRIRNGVQRLELRFDDIAGCLRTPEGGSSRQYLIAKNGSRVRARLLTVREAARLMGAPDTYVLPGSYNDGYRAMGDAVAAPVAEFLGKNILEPLVRHAYANS